MADQPAVIRRDDKGGVDDVAISGDGPFCFRLERMAKGSWWMAIYAGDKRVAFWLSRDGKRVEVTHVEDGIGCVDDSRPEPTEEEMLAQVEAMRSQAFIPATDRVKVTLNIAKVSRGTMLGDDSAVIV